MFGFPLAFGPAARRRGAVGDVVAVGDVTRLLGAPPAADAAPVAAAPEAASRFRLLGIMAPKQARANSEGAGVALIAVDGKPPRAYAVGAHLDGDLVLQSVSLRTVSIGSTQGSPPVVLDSRLPPQPPVFAASALPPPLRTPPHAVAPPFPGAPGGPRRPLRPEPQTQ